MLENLTRKYPLKTSTHGYKIVFFISYYRLNISECYAWFTPDNDFALLRNALI